MNRLAKTQNQRKHTMNRPTATKCSYGAWAAPVLAALIAFCDCRPALAADQTNAGISGEQQMRMDLMLIAGPKASLTILPVRLLGKRFDRVTEAVGLLL